MILRMCVTATIACLDRLDTILFVGAEGEVVEVSGVATGDRLKQGF